MDQGRIGKNTWVLLWWVIALCLIQILGFSPFNMLFERGPLPQLWWRFPSMYPTLVMSKQINNMIRNLTLFLKARSKSSAVQEIWAAVHHAKMGTRGYLRSSWGALLVDLLALRAYLAGIFSKGLDNLASRATTWIWSSDKWVTEALARRMLVL